MRVLQVRRENDIQKLMQDIHVDAYGIKIMVPKALNYLVRINSISHIAANILKQEMLSLGSEAAIARDAITGKAKKTNCLMMANLSQLTDLVSKLRYQPFGLAELANELSLNLSNYRKENFTLNLPRHRLKLESYNPLIMGIVNVTPDSFSGDGLLHKTGAESAIEHIQQIANDGAAIVDIGGESTRPGAEAVSVNEELSRVIPLIKASVKKIKVPISVDTYKPEVAKQALDSGASIINDITGLRNPKMRKIVAHYKAGVIIMHMRGTPKTMQKNPKYNSLIDQILQELSKSIDTAVKDGIGNDKIIVDPGIGFGKTTEHNLEIIKSLKEFRILGKPILIGTSRKSFIGKVLNTGYDRQRLLGTAASCIIAAQNSANIIRVHDVKQIKEALTIVKAINK